MHPGRPWQAQTNNDTSVLRGPVTMKTGRWEAYGAAGKAAVWWFPIARRGRGRIACGDQSARTGVALWWIINDSNNRRKEESIIYEKLQSDRHRYTYITNLINEGVDPKTVQYLAGHENSKVTMDIYARVKYNKPWELAEVVNKAFQPGDNGVDSLGFMG